ncbi:Multi-sensor Hybrid Histidine Kinase [Mycoavidus cysteinexigens]|uniref:Multi-sensor Hybrid Histidine Kinase n=1 Tax=Mycoavidus cysteinexigens TaxID=1553431 RepID=A0A2Z6EX20_9BURK|nr:Multi-sensor Hybrid Histidine Kinase [Mycoavidus cysteinexigens]GAM53659.1 hypothetical protein EBME_2122 [bacterium endosymbiont of Mortierella elongata FMR23-6]GLR01757.1 hypothetical protein GCM10007934_15690 [Mycoavidus cysteinexigens]
MIKRGKEYKAVLRWSSGHAVLTVEDTIIEGVEGLSEMNRRLLKQRRALLFEREEGVRSSFGESSSNTLKGIILLVSNIKKCVF